jgi:exonuclease SbcC
VIPNKLSLLNFMCYRQAALDLSGIHVACLSGENGAGKSALLDALTWALWGKARTRRDDELIHLGHDEMEVDLTFQLGRDLLRVLRRRQAGKRGRTILEFQIQDGEHWRSLSESTIRDTQAKIERVLRLDYDTFVNSAFLRQGRADEFTVKTPAERKRVLGDILGLEAWAVYEERAKERLRGIQEQKRTLDLRLDEIAAELLRRPEYEAQLQIAREEVVALGDVLREAQEAWQRMEALRTELRHLRAQLVELDARAAQARLELEALQRERQERETQLAWHQGLLAEADEIEARFAAFCQAQEQERALGQKLTALGELNERRNEVERQLADARHALETQREVAARQVADVQGRLAAPELLQELEGVRARITHLTQLQQSLDAARTDMVQISEERAALTAQNDTLRREMTSLSERIARLEEAEADCPLCGRPLSEEDRLRLVEELREEGARKGDAFRTNRERLASVVTQVAGLEAQISETEAHLHDLAGLEAQAATLAERVRAGDETAQVLAGAGAELERLEAELEAEAYAPELREDLDAVLRQAAELGYDPEAHQAARRAVMDGQSSAEQKARLDVARSGVEQEQAALARLEEAVVRWQERETADRERRAELQGVAVELEGRLVDAPGVEEELARVRVAEAEARQRLGAAEQRLAACDALVQQQESRSREREELARLASVYEELRTAFGVQGVPAMIIEAVVPEIESEANRLLNRMTDGRMHVRLETQRETLAGEVRETLDIRIMDELGERPYENYSGGEQFRVNFALRIALSRLLARRSGAQLQTLIVDEGFGSQDARGRERLVEAIHAIQDEFARVLVITHIEELQDAFPVRIQVTKGPEGSAVEVA